MQAAFTILAEQDPTVKIVIGVIVAAFWIGVQIFGAITKKPDRGLPPSGKRPARVPPTARPGGANPPRPPQTPQRSVSRQKPPPVRGGAKRPVAAIPQPAVAAQVRRETAASSLIATASRPMPRSDMLQALLKPRNLQKAFVLTELLQPPLSLRPKDERLG